MSKGKKRPQKGEYTRPQHQPPLPSPVLPPAKAERLHQAFAVYILMSGWYLLCEMEDVADIPMLMGALAWLRGVSWPHTEEEFWGGPLLLERRPDPT